MLIKRSIHYCRKSVCGDLSEQT